MLYFELLQLVYSSNFTVASFMEGKNTVQRGFYQEALFNIFYILHMRSSTVFRPAGGNFSAGYALQPFDMIEFLNRNVRSGSDVADLAMISESMRIITVCTSKYLAKYNGIDDVMEVAKILARKPQYPGYEINVLYVVHDKKQFICDQKKQRNTSFKYQPRSTYDLDTVQWMIDIVKRKFAIVPASPQQISDIYRGLPNLNPRFGQRIVSRRIEEFYAAGHQKMINGSTPRFGKSYCMAIDVSTIYTKFRQDLFIIITSQPVTIKSLKRVFEGHAEFKNFAIHNFNDKIVQLTKRPTIICISIQTLKARSSCMPDLDGAVCLIDEFHTSGNTKDTDAIMVKHNLHNSRMIFYSATYEKIRIHHKISAIVSWTIEDNIHASNLNENIGALRAKFGDCVPDDIDVKDTEQHYGSMPRMKFIVDRPSVICKERLDLDPTHRGYSFDAVKMIKFVNGEYELVNPAAVVSYFQHIFGEPNYDETMEVFVDPVRGTIYDYERMCRADNQRYGCSGSPLIIPVYMGSGIIEGAGNNDDSDTIIYITGQLIISCLNRERAKKTKWLNRYKLINYKTGEHNDVEQWFDHLVRKHCDCDYIILLLGSSLTTGITNKYVDFMVLTRPISSFDLFWQTVSRAMNECPARNKRNAYIAVSDYQNITALLNVVRTMMHKGETESNAWRRLLAQNIFNIVDTDYDGKFIDTQFDETYRETVYGIVRNMSPYSENMTRFINDIPSEVLSGLRNFYISLDGKKVRPKPSGIADGIERSAESKTSVVRVAAADEDADNSADYAEIIDEKNYIEMMEVFVSTCVFLTIDRTLPVYDILQYMLETSRWDMCVERCVISFGVDVKRSTAMIIRMNEIMLEHADLFNEMIGTLKEQLLSSNKTRCEYYELCQKSITTTAIERKSNAEVLTPLWLVWEMILKLPDVWVRDVKIFDPCVGKGAFMVVLFDLLFKRLRDIIPDSHERTRIILEDMLYFADINPFNIYITKLVLDPANEFKLNFYTGDTLQMDIKAEFKLEKFNIVVGNPPYNAAGGVATGNTLWSQFVHKALEWASGYVSFVHPSGWRKPNSAKGKFTGLFKLMALDNQMLYLEIHGIKDGKKTFNAGTRYDWYVIECVPKYTTTIIKDECEMTTIIDLTNWRWLPNYEFDKVGAIISKENEELCPIIYSPSAYEHRKKWMSHTQTDEFKYPCIHSTPKSGTRFMYSKFNDKGHFGISKVIFGESGIYNPVIDVDGQYGLTNGAFGILIECADEGENISKALQSVSFNSVIQSVMFSSFRIDWNIFKEFKKDFWQQFV